MNGIYTKYTLDNNYNCQTYISKGCNHMVHTVKNRYKMTHDGNLITSKADGAQFDKTKTAGTGNIRHTRSRD